MFSWRFSVLLFFVSLSGSCIFDTGQPFQTASFVPDKSSREAVPPIYRITTPPHTRVLIEEAAAHEQTPEPGATAALCTTLPEGARLRIVPDSETAFSIELTGFEAGESLVFVLDGEAEGQGAQLESIPVALVDANGAFRSDAYDLGPYSPISEWQGKVIHSRGVACFDFTLPLPEDPIDFGGEPYSQRQPGLR